MVLEFILLYFVAIAPSYSAYPFLLVLRPAPIALFQLLELSVFFMMASTRSTEFYTEKVGIYPGTLPRSDFGILWCNLCGCFLSQGRIHLLA